MSRQTGVRRQEPKHPTCRSKRLHIERKRFVNSKKKEGVNQLDFERPKTSDFGYCCSREASYLALGSLKKETISISTDDTQYALLLFSGSSDSIKILKHVCALTSNRRRLGTYSI